MADIDLSKMYPTMHGGQNPSHPEGTPYDQTPKPAATADSQDAVLREMYPSMFEGGSHPSHPDGTPYEPPADAGPLPKPKPPGKPTDPPQPAADTPPDDGTGVEWPEGMTPDDEQIEIFNAWADEKGIDPEHRREVLSMHAHELQKQQEAYQAEVEGWVEAAKADDELGYHWESKVAQAKAVVDQYGTPELKEFFNWSGLGNHPELIRLLSRMQKDVKHLMKKL